MIYNGHPKRNMLITLTVAVIGLMILFIFILPFLNIHSDFIKGMIVTLILVIACYPLFRYLQKKKNGVPFEKRHGRKLK